MPASVEGERAVVMESLSVSRRQRRFLMEASEGLGGARGGARGGWWRRCVWVVLFSLPHLAKSPQASVYKLRRCHHTHTHTHTHRLGC